MPRRRRRGRRRTNRVRAANARRDAVAGRDEVICLECGRAFRAVAGNHLIHRHGYAREAPVTVYRARFGLDRQHTCSHATREKARRLRVAYYQARGRRWTRARVVAEIRALARAGEPLEARTVQRHHSALHSAAHRRFRGSWGRALRAAGFDPRAHRKPKPGATLAQAVAWVRARHRAGRSIRGRDAPSRLHGVACRRTPGGWAAFVESLGIPYPGGRKRRDWTDRAVLDEIRRLKAAGHPLNRKAVQQRSQAVIHQARKRFGSWDAALRAAGLDPAQVRLARRWTRADVVVAIRRRVRTGAPVHAVALARGPLAARNLYRWALRLFGGWPAALRAAGLDPAAHDRPGIRLTLATVAERVRARARAGRPVRGHAIPVRWRALARATGFEWPDFVESLGLDYGPRLIRWSRDEVRRRLRARAREGRRLNAKAVHLEFSSLYTYGCRYFGSWDAALRAARVRRPGRTG